MRAVPFPSYAQSPPKRVAGGFRQALTARDAVAIQRGTPKPSGYSFR